MSKRNTQNTQAAAAPVNTQAAPSEPQAAAAPAATEQAAPVAVAAVTVAPTILAALRADGAAAYEGEAALLSFAQCFAKVMARPGQAGNFELFTEMARQWRIGYEAAKRGLSGEAVESVTLSDRSQDAFERRIKAAKSEASLGDNRLVGEKPKSASAASERMRETRKLPSGTPEQWMKDAAAKAKAGDYKAANEAQANAKKLTDKAASDAKKAATERLGKLKESAREVLKAILASDDERRINAAIAALRKLAPVGSTK